MNLISITSQLFAHYNLSSHTGLSLGMSAPLDGGRIGLTTSPVESLQAVVQGHPDRTDHVPQILFFPKHVTDLFSRCLKTGKEHSLFRHENPYEPAAYEIREGSAFNTDSTTLGDEEYSPIEEQFFGTKFVAHIHSPGWPPLPSERDLRIFAQRARLHPFKCQSHTVFGFVDGAPAFVYFTARLNRTTDRVEFLFRASSNVEWKLIAIVKRTAEEVASENDSTEAGKRAAASRPLWNPDEEELTQAIEEVLTKLGNDPDRISTDHPFIKGCFRLSSGREVSGYQVLSAIARLEKPEAKNAIEKTGGRAAVIRILKGKYLGLTMKSFVPVDLLSGEAIKRVTQEILTEHLDNNPDRISAGPSFAGRSFTLASGGEVSGSRILYAVARLERPAAKNSTDSIKELGGEAAVVRILKEKHLGLTVKPVIPVDLSSAKVIKRITREILTRHLNNDPDRISTSPPFFLHSFPLVAGGEVSGYQIFSAVARLERPEAKTAGIAIKVLGGHAVIAHILKKKYLRLTVEVDLSSAEAIKKVIQEILTEHLGNDPDRIVASKSFIGRSFPLTSRGKVNGRRIFFAVARLERPEAKNPNDAIKELGGHLAVLRILKEKYMGVTVKPLIPIDLSSAEAIKKVTQEILTTHLNNDPDRISTSPSFRNFSFSLASGGQVSGYQILFAVARLEKPEAKNVDDAVKKLGGPSAVLWILKEKYLRIASFQDISHVDLEQFIREKGLQEIVDMFSDDPALLAAALSFLKGKDFRNLDITAFVTAYVGLQVAGRREAGGRAEGVGGWERRRLYLLALLKAVEDGETGDLSEDNFKRQLSLLIRLSRKDFEEAPSRLLEELETKAISPIHPFVQRLYAEAARHFRATQSFELKGVRTPAFAYQREGAHFLATHNRAILADEAGMGKSYQMIAAVQTLELKRVLWITTAANKGTLKEEILTHSFTNEDEIQIVISGDPKERTAQIHTLNGTRYVITNYETLVALQKGDPEGYRKLTKGLDAVIVDEAQMTDNPETLRTKAVHDIQAPRRWLATATPYQNRPSSVWTLLNWLHPEKYPSRTAFKQMYCDSSQGLLLLHSEMSEWMIRRTKRDTLSPFQPVTEVSFEAQLANGVPRIPTKVRISPESGGNYPLSLEQSDLIAWMTADFRGWAEAFNTHLPAGAEPINLETINPLLKFEMIQKAIYQPEWFGLQGENPLFVNLDRIVAKRIARGEKIILWAWNTSILDALEKRYRDFGVRRIDGTVVGEERERARHDYQEDPDVRMLIGNYQSGGAGLTLTAADCAIFVQFPPQYPLLYQVEGRNHRLIGLANLRYAKERVEMEWLVPQFPPAFVEGIEDKRLAEILSHGTLVEQTRRRLDGGEVLYNLVMEGYGDVETLETYFKMGIIRSMGLAEDQRLDYVSHLKGEAQILAGVLRDLLPLWRLVESHAEAEDRVLQLVDALSYYPWLASRIGEAFRNTSQAHRDDLDFLLSFFQIGNKYIRQQLLERVPELLVEVYGRGQSLTQAAQGLKIGKLSLASFVAQIYLRGRGGGEAVVEIAKELGEQRDTPVKRYLEEHFFMGIFGILNQPAARTLVKDKDPLFSKIKLEDRIHALYRIGLLSRARPDIVEGLQTSSFDSWEPFFGVLEKGINRAIAEFCGKQADQAEAMIRINPNWRGNADPLLALIAGWQEQDEAKLLDQAKESIDHILEGDYRPWRNGPNGRVHGNAIDYLSDDPEFWEVISRPHKTKIDRLAVSPQNAQSSLAGDYLAIVESFFQEGEALEGKWVGDQFASWRFLADPDLKRQILEHRQDEIRDLAREMTGTSELSQKTVLKRKLEEKRNLVSWMVMDQTFEAMEAGRGRDEDRSAFIRELDSKIKFYRMRHYDKLADHFEALKNRLANKSQTGLNFQNLVIEDTDDPAILARMGALHPEMLNCFNPNGNPIFNQFVVSAWGSRNMRMVTVREQGKIVAAAMMKVKQLEDGEPVLFLERGLYRKGYDFRKEMLRHLDAKASQLSPKTVVMDEARGRSVDGDTTVYGTGAFTEYEYVEPVFGLRRVASVKHAGRPFVAKETEQETLSMGGTSKISGIGTSNKTIKKYIAELRAQGIKIVVDVRGAPYSRFYPHFNKDRLAYSLRRAGIDYIWMGETLGNPKDAAGQRTLQGFQRYMRTKKYQGGLEGLAAVVEASAGKVALTCAEGNEEDCHRKFILADLGAATILGNKNDD